MTHVHEFPYIEIDADQLTVERSGHGAARDQMTSAQPVPRVESAANAIIASWKQDPNRASPLADLRSLLDSIREEPRGDLRARSMNTLVRSLGEPRALADLLDILRWCLKNGNEADRLLATQAQGGKMHAAYGWAGSTSIVLSSPAVATGTTPPAERDLEDRLKYPVPIWELNLHVWQPTTNATPFECGANFQGVYAEPPHSHPYDFVSMISAGEVTQYVYKEKAADDEKGERGGRYEGTPLQHVDGVWPPHLFRKTAYLRTLERVEMAVGDSYFMPCNRIHDVEVSAATAHHRPAVTLMLLSESAVMPHAYMASAMADHHQRNPDLIAQIARPQTPRGWEQKLERVSRYLRDPSAGLRAADIVEHDSDYAFLHR
jgi:hypothetical protein